jgi:hypothetical protein
MRNWLLGLIARALKDPMLRELEHAITASIEERVVELLLKRIKERRP